MQSLDRGLRLLMTISRHGPCTCSELAYLCGIPRASVSRYLKTLTQRGLVRSNERPKSYQLTSGILSLSHGFDRWDRLTEIAARTLEKPDNQLLWPLSVVTPLGLELVIRFNTDQRSPLALERYRVGEVLPLLDTASGLAFLASITPSERAQYLDLIVDSTADVSVNLLSKALLDVREKGYAIHKRVSCTEAAVSVPLYQSDDCMGALAMRFIPSALNTDKIVGTYVPKLIEMSSEIARTNTAKPYAQVEAMASLDHADN